MKQIKLDFYDKVIFPKRGYDQFKYRNYIEYAMGKERDDEFRCYCYYIFDEKLADILLEHFSDSTDCTCDKININQLNDNNYAITK